MPSVPIDLAPIPTTFVGRQAMLDALARSLESARLVTVVGPPGVGKTRLVKHHARALAARGDGPRGGVVFCDLTEATTRQGAIARVASVVVAERAEASAEQTQRRVEAALDAREATLVILDNFEQLVPSGTPLVQELLERTPAHVRFVVTSRERLSVPLELVLELPPLALGEGATRTGSEAVDLFVQRARAALPSFAPQGEELASVATLVALLDGLPLAIELAAARIPMLAPAELIERIGSRFGWLTHSALVARARPATLRETLATSWALLTPWERSALAQVSVFRGGFDVAAAEKVLDLTSFAAAPSTLDVLQSLREKSLLTDDAGGGSTRRLALLVSIRAFAEEALDPAERDAAHARHARAFVALGQALSAQLASRDDADVRARLRREHENLLAAHERFLGASEPPDLRDASLSIALVLARTWSSSAHALALGALDAALARVDEARTDRRLLALALEARGNARRFLGQIRESIGDFERMRALAEAEGDQALVALAFSGLGNAATVRAQWSEAQALFERALAIVARSGDRGAEGRLLAMLAATHFNRDDPAAARALLVGAIALLRETNDRAFEGICVTSLGIVSLALGSRAEARGQLTEAIDRHRELGSRHWESVTLSYLALAEQEEGRLRAARALYDEALAMLAEAGVRRAEGLALAASAGACVLDGALDEARRRMRRAIEIARVMSPDHEASFHACLGAIAALEGDLAAAADALDAADRALALHPRPAFAAAVAVHRGHLALVRARDGSSADRAAALDEARGRLALAAPWQERSLDVRFARDLLARSIDEHARALERSTVAIVVGPDGVWFKLPRAKRAVHLHRRHALHRLVRALAEERLRAPGAAVSIPELVARGWPGERVLPEAGAERVYTAVATLRKLGLREVLVRADEGYLFAPAFDIVWSLSSTPP